MDDFYAWLSKNGVCFDDVEVTDLEYGKGKGLKCVRKFSPGDVIIAIPEALLMSTKSARRDDLLQPFAGKLSAMALLCLHLMVERNRGAHSFWGPYLSILPSAYPEMVVYWSEEELAELQDERTISKLRKSCDKARNMFQTELLPVKRASAAFSFLSDDLFLWAWSTVMSRGCYCPIDVSKKDVTVLVPMADFMNHETEKADLRPHENAGLLDTGKYVFRARRPFDKGSELFLSYGEHANYHLLKYYGFCLPSNPFEKVDFSEAVDEWNDVPLLAEKREARGMYSLDSYADGYVDEIPYSIKASLRVFALQDRSSFSRDVATIVEGSKVSSECDQIMYRRLLAVCQAKLSAYPTTIDDDATLLPPLRKQLHDVHAYRVYTAVVQRMGAKTVIRSIQKRCERKLETYKRSRTSENKM